MKASEMLSDAIAHGTLAGWRQGCKTAHCPGTMACRDVARRYAGDFGFKKRLDSGMTIEEIIAAEAVDAQAAKQRELDARMAARAARQRSVPFEDLPEDPVVVDEVLVHGVNRGWHQGCRSPEGCPNYRIGVTCSTAHQQFESMSGIEFARAAVDAERAARAARRTAERPARAPREPRVPRERKPRRVAQHGTMSMYVAGCRKGMCPNEALGLRTCHEAQRDYQREYQARRRAAGPAGKHGTPYGYQLGCRDRESCPGGPDGVTCSDASLEQERRRNRERGIPEQPPRMPAAPVVAHIRWLMESGVPLLTVADRAEVSRSVVKALLYGKRGKPQVDVTAAIASKILAVAA